MVMLGKETFKKATQEVKKTMAENIKNGKASTRAKNKYNAANYDSLRIVVPKGKKDQIKAYAESKNESLNGFVNRAIDEAMESNA